MKVYFGLPEDKIADACCVTMGSYDGLHLGHMHVWNTLMNIAKDNSYVPVFITYEPHPKCIIEPDNCPQALTTLDERLEFMESAGAEIAIIIEFNKRIAAMPARDFIANLCEHINIKHIVVGADHTFGKDRAGNPQLLKEYGLEFGFEVTIVEDKTVDGQRLHSSQIRHLLRLGEVEAAAKLLGRNYTLTSHVEHGSGVGRKIGFPTINLVITPNKLIPGRGVYACWAYLRQRKYMSAVNVGYRPTFGANRLTVEAYILDFDGDLYNEKVTLEFVKRLRDEEKYNSVEELIDQIKKDVDQTRAILDS